MSPIAAAQKWRRVSFGSALSQGEIREKSPHQRRNSIAVDLWFLFFSSTRLEGIWTFGAEVSFAEGAEFPGKAICRSGLPISSFSSPKGSSSPTVATCVQARVPYRLPVAAAIGWRQRLFDVPFKRMLGTELVSLLKQPAAWYGRAGTPEQRQGSQFLFPHAPWHFLYFFPLPQGQGSLRPTLSSVRWTVWGAVGSSPRLSVLTVESRYKGRKIIWLCHSSPLLTSAINSRSSMAWPTGYVCEITSKPAIGSLACIRAVA